MLDSSLLLPFFSLAGTNLRHVVVLAESRKVRVEFLDALLVRFEKFGTEAHRLCCSWIV